MKAHETATIRMLLELAIVQGLAISLYDGGAISSGALERNGGVADRLAEKGESK